MKLTYIGTPLAKQLSADYELIRYQVRDLIWKYVGTVVINSGIDALSSAVHTDLWEGGGRQ